MVSPAHESHLLAYVLAHEIVHILEGTGRHSATGIMKAQWTPEDYSGIASGKLTFASEDIELLHGGLVVRQARLNTPSDKSVTEPVR
jgi:predicted Zn-dependent protease